MPKGGAVFFTVCYPKALPYLDDFLNSLTAQTDQDFDVFVVNDSCGPLEERFRRYRALRICEFPATGSLAQIRQLGFEEVLVRGYGKIVFGDCDDRFSPDRVAVVKGLLQDWDVVVNDVSLFGERQVTDYFSGRLKDGAVIRLEDILTKNFMGLSNTAIRAEWLRGVVLADTPVVDWYLFSRLLAKGAKAVFCGRALTDYRQHAGNMAVFSGNEERRNEVKRRHYQTLEKDCPELIPLIEARRASVQGLRPGEHPFWWEG